jgi:hypothetical protein
VTIPSSHYVPDLTPEQLEALRPHPGPPPLPKAATEAEIEVLRQRLRETVHEVQAETTRLNGLHAARERAYADRHAAWAALAEAQAALNEAKKFGRQHLVAAYVDQVEITTPTPADCQTTLDLRTEQYNLAREVEQAIAEEISTTEADLAGHCRRRDAALSALVCVHPRFVALYERQAQLWIELRSLRICMHAVGSAMGGSGLTQELLSLAQASENINDRRVGFPVDEDLIDTWVNEVRALSEDGDALLPGDTRAIDRTTDGSDITDISSDITNPVGGGHRGSAPRNRGSEEAKPPVSDRLPLRKRAVGKRGSSRGSRPSRFRDRRVDQTVPRSPSERDPATG